MWLECSKMTGWCSLMCAAVVSWSGMYSCILGTKSECFVWAELGAIVFLIQMHSGKVKGKQLISVARVPCCRRGRTWCSWAAEYRLWAIFEEFLSNCLSKRQASDILLLQHSAVSCSMHMYLPDHLQKDNYRLRQYREKTSITLYRGGCRSLHLITQ